MGERVKLNCPDCGVEMNLHAEKVDYTRPTEASTTFDDDLGGQLTAFHTCPACGRTDTRHAE